MKKVPQDPGLSLAKERWQFFDRLFRALRSGGRQIMERSLQGAVERQVEAVRGTGAESAPARAVGASTGRTFDETGPTRDGSGRSRAM